MERVSSENEHVSVYRGLTTILRNEISLWCKINFNFWAYFLTFSNAHEEAELYTIFLHKWIENCIILYSSEFSFDSEISFQRIVVGPCFDPISVDFKVTLLSSRVWVDL